MVKDTGESIKPSRVGIYPSENEKYSPFRLEKIREMGTRSAPSDLVQDANGNKFVFRTRKVNPFEAKELGLKEFIDSEIKFLTECGINAAPYQAIIHRAGSEENFHDELTLLTDYVDGEDIKTAPLEQQITRVRGLLKYYGHKFHAEEDFLVDIARSDQYLYGNVKGGGNRIYLIDIEFGQNSVFRETGSIDLKKNRELGILIEVLTLFENSPDMSKLVQNDLNIFMDSIDSKSLPSDPELPDAKEIYDFLQEYKT